MAQNEKGTGKVDSITSRAHAMDEKELLLALNTNIERGLGAEQVLLAREKFGLNSWSVEQKQTAMTILLRQVSNSIILLLIAAAGVAAFVGHVIDAIGIIAAVLLSVIFGFFQEYKAEAALSALQKLTSPKSRVLRDGREEQISSEELVPGDVLLLHEGDLAPADARLLSGSNLSADQSTLTGESQPIEKHAKKIAENTPMAERDNIVYAGTTIVRGSGRAVVFATGLTTQFGAIAESLAGVQSGPTPLQKDLQELGEKIGKAAIGLCMLFFAVGVWAHISTWDEMLLTAVTMAVAAIPEGLPTVLAITLALGVQRMAGEKALVRKLQAVETLGSASVICTDKTGTLTANRMTLIRANLAGGDYQIGGGPDALAGSLTRTDGKTISKPELERLQEAMETAVLCNEAGVQLWGEEKIESVRGDPTEVALLVGAAKIGINVEKLRAAHSKKSENPFDYERKMMAQIRADGSRHTAYVKGAPEKVLEHCKHVMTERGIAPMTEKKRKEIHALMERYSHDALRTLGLARRSLRAGEEKNPDKVEKDLIWVGLAGMIDPPRPEAKEALALCQKAGIRVIMLTGDAPITAKVIAGQLGLLPKEHTADALMSGEELEKLSDARLATRLPYLHVLARATPAHKFRIITALQKMGEVVAVTGDGVNDAPSIKKADIGVAMGIGGTDVARGAADMVLTDNNFSTLVMAVEQGRSIYENIRSFVRFQFTTNVAALSLMFITPLIGLGLPLLPLQILWINIIMDGPPAIALGLEPGHAEVMDRPPRKRNAPFVGKAFLGNILCSGMLMFLLSLGIFAYYQTSGDVSMAAEAGTMAFTVFVCLQLVNAFNCRSVRFSAFDRPLANKWLVLAAGISLALQLSIIYLPQLQAVFGTVALGAADWGIIVLAGAVMLAKEELLKKMSLAKV